MSWVCSNFTEQTCTNKTTNNEETLKRRSTQNVVHIEPVYWMSTHRSTLVHLLHEGLSTTAAAHTPSQTHMHTHMRNTRHCEKFTQKGHTTAHLTIGSITISLSPPHHWPKMVWVESNCLWVGQIEGESYSSVWILHLKQKLKCYNKKKKRCWTPSYFRIQPIRSFRAFKEPFTFQTSQHAPLPASRLEWKHVNSANQNS